MLMAKKIRFLNNYKDKFKTKISPIPGLFIKALYYFSFMNKTFSYLIELIRSVLEFDIVVVLSITSTPTQV
ncbi:hypothetical protein BpHYR1_051865 [Brachionus plicatilis]|uniref:Uncharacterized protein n=1 Tax=Brachionus plicatilis TaxID=10195 RepID=A0A3M7RF13_BRAPC|nr:hypothetical protein BpHYR1_051865 [Brachionus plicatilis]